MEPVIYSWNAITAINDGTNYRATFQPGQMAIASANPVTVTRSGLFPFFSTTVLNSRMLVVSVDIMPGNNIPTFRETLKSYFDVTDKVLHNLIIKDSNDSNRQWYVSGRVTGFVERTKLTYTVSIYLDEPVWKLVTAGTNTWNITATGQTNAVSNIGNLKVAPSFAITPTSARTGGLTYRRWVAIYNQMDSPFDFVVDVTGGGLDTATLTTTKMQADGDDFRLWEEGTEQNRWLSGMDTSTTLCQARVSLPPHEYGTTSVNIAGSGAITTITFADTKANRAFLQAMTKVNNKAVLIDSEGFIFTGVNMATRQLTGVTRASKGTAMAAHTAPKTAHHIPIDLWILYGDSTLSAPDVDDNFKPMFDLSSTNTSLSFTYFRSSIPTRPAQWTGEVNATRTGTSYVFTSTENNFADPSTELGLAMRNPSATSPTAQETAQLDWIFSHPAGITDVVYSGSKYMSGETFPAVCGLQKLQPDTIWITENNEAAPADPYTWQDFGPHTIDLGSTYYNTIRFTFDGTLSTTADDAAMVEFDTVVLTIASANMPAILLGPEQAIVFFDFTLTNNTTGEFITCKTPCPLNSTLTIDCENKSVSLSNGERAVVGFSTERATWLDMNTGSNTFQYDETGVNAVTIITSHRDRIM